MDFKLFDKRVVKRNINNGLISKEDHNKYLESLQDAAFQAEPVRERLFGGAEEVFADEGSATEADK